MASTILHKYDTNNNPILVGVSRDEFCIINILSVLMSGNYYIPVDLSQPEDRIQQIINISKSKLFIVSDKDFNKIKNFNIDIIINSKIYTNFNDSNFTIRKNIMPNDPFCGIFTSGSTGIPKCVIKSHITVTTFINIFSDIFNITSNNILGNHVSFDFDVSIKDIFVSLKNCCTLHIFPKSFLTFPLKMVQYIIDNNIDTFICSTPILKFIKQYEIMDNGFIPYCLKKVFFSGEEMPNKVLNYWKNFLPETKFINLYAPTEVTGNCLYYISSNKLPENSPLPLGKNFPHCDVFLIDNNKLITSNDEIGEIYIRSVSLAYGYLNDIKKTSEVFIQNPFIDGYRDIVYKTGDLGKYDKDKNIIFVGRKDSQIKYNGHRIELTEIELCALQVKSVEEVFCLFNKNNNEIVLIYQSHETCDNEIIKNLKSKLPSWMLPRKLHWLKKMPVNSRLKIDRTKLVSMYGI